MFVDQRHPNPKTGVHVVIAGERIRAHYEHPAPDPAESARADAEFQILSLPALVGMKLQAFRRVDQVHIEDLLRAELIDDDLINTLPPDLTERLTEIRETME